MNIRKISYFLWSIGVVSGLLLTLALQQPLVIIKDESTLDSDPTSWFVNYSYTTHVPISVTNDGQFDAIKSSGNGSAVDPYIIEGWEINTSTANGIRITGTTSHFIIRNCLLVGNAGSTYRGIDLYHIANGTGTVQNCTLYKTGYDGIRVDNADFTTLMGNTVIENENYGINVYVSANVTMINNTCNNAKNYGINLWDSDDLTLINNTCNYNVYGIYSYNSDNPIVINNTFSHNTGTGCSFTNPGSSIISYNTGINNSGTTIRLYNAPKSKISNNTLMGSLGPYGWEWGLDLSNCPNSNVTGNEASITLYSSGYSNILANTLTGRGLSSYNCPYTTITDNIFINTGLRVGEWSKESTLSITVTDNIVNGLPLGFIENMTGGTISTVYGQLILINCNNTIVRDQNYSNIRIGISLNYCNNVELINNTCNNNAGEGINIDDSNSSIVVNNTCNFNEYSGISLDYSYHSYIYNNICNESGDGIYISGSADTQVINNSVYLNNEKDRFDEENCGIDIDESPNSEIINNTVVNSGFAFWEYSKDDYLSQTVLDNLVNGLPLGYIENQTGLEITGSSIAYGQLILINCNSSSVIGQNYSNTLTGITLNYCNATTVVNNICNDNGKIGIRVRYSDYANITGNICNNNSWVGISLRDSPYSNVYDNYCTGNGGDDEGTGIETESSQYSTFFNNILLYNGAGFGGEDFSDIVIANNTINYNSYQGISFWDAYSGIIANNTIKGNGMPDEWGNPSSGISISNSENIIITNNFLIRNGGFGVRLSDSSNTTVYQNYFLDNPGYFHQRVSQGFDNDLTNHWNLSTVGNYWSDYNGSGAYPMDSYGFDPDGLDYYPTLLNPTHDISDPIFIYPTNGESLSGVVTFQWTTAVDTLWHDVTYTLGYSVDGSTKIEITNTTKTEFDVDTTSFANGTYYFYVFAVCSELLTSEIAWVYPVTISNVVHSLSIPTVISPNGGETLSDTVSIHWTAVTDSWSHTVTYTVSYSADSGSTWTNITTGYATTSYDWDTTTVTDGANYMIRIIAKCSTGLTNADTVDTTFSISNVVHSLSIPTVISPNGGETLSDTVSIQWTAVTDSLFHTVTYTISYSTDSGSTWKNITTGHTTTSYDWDTTTVTDGANYMIRVIVTCSTGLISEDTSNTVFTIMNTETSTITTTTITETITTDTSSIIGSTDTTSETVTPTIGSTSGFGFILVSLGMFFYLVFRRRKK